MVVRAQRRRFAGTLLASLLVCSAAPSARAAPVDWDGGGGNAFWDIALNWSGNTLPTSADDVSNTTTTNIEHRSGTDFINSFLSTLASLTISNGSTLRIGAGGISAPTVTLLNGATLGLSGTQTLGVTSILFTNTGTST